MRLVGASDAFIRWPFVFEGAFVGFLGAAITLGVLAAAAEPLNGFMVEFFRVLPLQVGSLTRDLVTLVMGDGRRARHPRLVGVGPDLPHPLAAGGSYLRAGAVPTRPGVPCPPRHPHRRPRHATTQPCNRPETERPDRLDVPARPGRDPVPGPPIRPDPADRHRGRRAPRRRRAVHVRATRWAARPRSSRARRSARTRRSARSGTPTTRSTSATPAARSTATRSSRARSAA